jgi:DNA (cytosine-5)-methyltransferase 1
VRFLSVCSGIEAASVAWGNLGWEAVGFSEIEAFPSAVLAHHYPTVPNYGDMTQLPDMLRSGLIDLPDLLCGGTPCQAFSVAGKRASLDDARGNLSLTFCEIANAIDDERIASGLPAGIVFWENVPGVFSTKDNAFGCFLGELAGEDCAVEPPGGRWTDAGVVLGPKRTVAWRTLDAQYFGVAQRRRRVFVVASARDGFDPVKVLLEWEGVRRDSAPSREAREATSCLTAPRTGGGGSYRLDAKDVDGGFIQAVQVCPTLRAGGNSTGGDRPPGTDVDTADSLIAFHPTQDPISSLDGTTHATNGSLFAGQPVAFTRCDHGGDAVIDATPTMRCGSNYSAHLAVAQPIPFDTTQLTSPSNYSNPQPGDPCHPLARGAHAPAVAYGADLSQKAEGIGFTEELSPCVAPGTHPDHGNHVLTSVAQPVAQEVVAALTASGRGVERTGESRGQDPVVAYGMQVRRLTPRECERLQGFPDDYTQIPWRKKDASECPDGPRYKALGNSWAVPVVRWIGQRMQWEMWGLL